MIDKTTLHFTTQQCPSALVEINESLRGENFVCQGRILRTKFYKNGMPIHPLPGRILRTKFYKNGMPIHSLPERILRTNFTKRKCHNGLPETMYRNNFQTKLPERIARRKTKI
jgi:hypothetical protein